MTTEQLQEKQRVIEDLAISNGTDRFYDKFNTAVRKGTVSNTLVGKRLLNESLWPVSQALSDLIETDKKRTGPRRVAVSVLETVGPDVAAYLTAKAVIDSFTSTLKSKSRRTTAAGVAMKIAEYIIDECRYRKLPRKLAKYKQDKFKKLRSRAYSHKRRSMNHTVKFSGVDVSEFEGVSLQDRGRLGSMCLEIFEAATGYCESKTVWVEGHKQNTVVTVTDKVFDWITQFNKDHEEDNPKELPLIIRPKPWSRTGRGGYWYALAGRHPFIRRFEDYRRVNETAQAPLSDVVYKAVNAVQNTSWAINRDIHAVIVALQDTQSSTEIAGIPSHFDAVLPALLAEEYLAGRTVEEQRELKSENAAKRGHAINANHLRKCKRLAFVEIMNTVRTLLENDLFKDDRGEPLPFYFPFSCDFRGRMYPLAETFQPQGDDRCRGMLRFAEGKPLGSQDALEWLIVHGANCLGTDHNGNDIDKLSRIEQIEWIEQHERDILDTANDWRSGQWFWGHEKVDSPFQFLAFCFEYRDFIRSGRSLDFKSHLPVSMDGTCNGLQHMAALIGDKQLAQAVNLGASPLRRDIYKDVADKVSEILGNRANTDTEAVYWIKTGMVNRKIAKKPVMTLAYGSTPYGRKKAIREYVWKQSPNETYDNIRYLVSVFEEALKADLKAALQLMEHLEEIAKGAADNQIRWISPSGFNVVQPYMKKEVKRIRTKIAGGACLSLQRPTNEVDPDKQVQGIVPNVVHSIDASHMHFVLAGTCHTVSHFQMVHDSFACHACDANFLSTMVRTYFKGIHDAEYNPKRGLDSNGAYFPNRPWDDCYSPFLKLCGLQRDDDGNFLTFRQDEDGEIRIDRHPVLTSEIHNQGGEGGTLLGHIKRCISERGEAHDDDMEVNDDPLQETDGATLWEKAVLADRVQARPELRRGDFDLAEVKVSGGFGNAPGDTDDGNLSE